MNPSAIVVCSAAAVTPTLPTSRGQGAAITSHSGAGLYEITLDEAMDEEECCALAQASGTPVDSTVEVRHTSDTVKTVVTRLAGVLDDTIPFSVAFFRLPAGHPAA